MRGFRPISCAIDEAVADFRAMRLGVLMTLTMATLLTGAGCSSGQQTAAEEPPARSAEPTTVEPTPETTADERAPQSSSTRPGRFSTLTGAGAIISIDIPVRASDPRVADIEQARSVAQAPPLTYLVADVDNRNGSGDVVMEYVVVLTGDGTAVEVPRVAGTADGVLEQLLSGADQSDVAAYNALVDLVNHHLDFQRVRTGQLQKGLVYATYDEIPSIARVSAPVEELGPEVKFTRDPKGVSFIS